MRCSERPHVCFVGVPHESVESYYDTDNVTAGGPGCFLSQYGRSYGDGTVWDGAA